MESDGPKDTDLNMVTRRFASQFLALDGESMLTIRIAKREILDVLFVIGLLSLPLLSAEKPKDAVPPAPVPSPIAAAKKVFISNAPGNNLPTSLGGPDRTYNEFYAESDRCLHRLPCSWAVRSLPRDFCIVSGDPYLQLRGLTGRG